MDDLYGYVLSQVTEYITEVQERMPEDSESDRLARTVCQLADSFISTQIRNALN